MKVGMLGLKDRGADFKYMKDGHLEKRLNLLFVDQKSKTVTSQGHFLGDISDLSHSAKEHRIWNRTDLGSSPDFATSWFRGLKQFSAFLHSLHLSL